MAIQTPILVLAEGITALGALRALARARLPAYTVPIQSPMVARSRWHRPLVWGAEGPPSPETLAQRLESAPPLPEAVLLPGSDDWARSAARLPEALRRRFPVSVAGPQVLERFIDKARFARTLQEVGIAHPHTEEVDTPGKRDDVGRLVPDGGFLKPCDSAAFFRTFGVKAFSVNGRGELKDRLLQVQKAGLRVMVQEYIPGPASAHVFLDGFRDRHGRITGLLVRRRLRMYPEDFGNSTLTVTVPAHEAQGAVTALRTLLDALDYRGIFSAEFKEDPRDGRFKLLEVNPRAWWYVDFTARCGVDVCQMAYRDALELPVPEVRAYRLGVRCIHPDHDVAAFRMARENNGARPLSWFRPWVGAHQTVFALSDPGPALHMTTAALRRRLTRFGFSRSVSPRSSEAR